ncbi:hypothetical protein ABNQ38_36590 (plasmid) [Azospirillum sp. A29]|uniref:hypothetical protein n=1 Tax=Azospirillum sp. A29 TaxID=3160606 RepID=UPI00366BC102
MVFLEPEQELEPIVVKVFVDATLRNTCAAWGAVAFVGGRKPHVMSGQLPRRKNTNILEMLALQRAEIVVQRWLRRHGLRARLLILHSDNQGIAEQMAAKYGKRKLVYRWLAREHPAMRLAHRVAKVSCTAAISNHLSTKRLIDKSCPTVGSATGAMLA